MFNRGVKKLRTSGNRAKNFFYRLLIESRRILSLFLLPWVSIFLICFSISWYSLLVLELDVLLAPILKFWLLLKPLLFNTVPAVLLWLWVNTVSKAVGLLGELLALVGTLLGGWKAWSAKKLARQTGRFLLSLSARFIAVSVLFNMLFGHERRGIKSLPRFAMYKLRSTWVGRALRLWTQGSERQKRLVFGVILCLILIVAGQAMLGISVLLFDLAWELILLLWRMVFHLWRVFSPFLLKLVPNFIGNFITGKLVPFVADLVPIIKDDLRVMYLRFNFRRHSRRFKAWLYLNSRARRSELRNRITPLVGENMRARKSALLKAAVKLRENHPKNDEML